MKKKEKFVRAVTEQDVFMHVNSGIMANLDGQRYPGYSYRETSDGLVVVTDTDDAFRISITIKRIKPSRAFNTTEPWLGRSVGWRGRGAG